MPNMYYCLSCGKQQTIAINEDQVKPPEYVRARRERGLCFECWEKEQPPAEEEIARLEQRIEDLKKKG